VRSFAVGDDADATGDHAATPAAMTTLPSLSMTWSDRAVAPPTASLAAGGGLGVENAPFLVVGETGADLGSVVTAPSSMRCSRLAVLPIA
jgi:hypothetical protein